MDARISGRMFLMAALLLGWNEAGICKGHTYLIGAVVDTAANAHPVSDANIVIVGTSYGCTADSTGKFVIPNPPLGTHAVKVSHVGYQTGYFYFRIDSGRTIFVYAVLHPAMYEFEGPTVIGISQVMKYYRRSSAVDIPHNEIEKDDIIDWLGLFTAKMPFVESGDYALFVDGIATDPDMLSTINVRYIKEVFVWRWVDAPVQYKVGLRNDSKAITGPIGSSPLTRPPMASITWFSRHYVILILTH